MNGQAVHVIANFVSRAGGLNHRTSDLQGLGGSLVLLGLSIGLFCLGVLMGIVETQLPLIANGAWDTLSGIDPALAYVIAAEFSIELAFAAAGFCLSFLFYAKSKHFAYWFILLGAAWIIYRLVDLIVFSMISPDTGALRATQVIYASMWFTVLICYLRKSQRVKNTFTY